MLESIYRYDWDVLCTIYHVLLGVRLTSRLCLVDSGDWRTLRKAHSLPVAAASLCKILKVSPTVHALVQLKTLFAAGATRRPVFFCSSFLFFFAA